MEWEDWHCCNRVWPGICTKNCRKKKASDENRCLLQGYLQVQLPRWLLSHAVADTPSNTFSDTYSNTQPHTAANSKSSADSISYPIPNSCTHNCYDNCDNSDRNNT